MSIKKITLASLILFSLTACSSGGGSSPNNDALQSELSKTKDQLANYEQSLNSTKTELAQAQTDLNTASSNLKTAQTELAKVQADNTATAQELTTAKENLAKAENAKAIAEKALATANSEKQAVEKALNSAKTELSQAQTDLNTASSNLKTAQTELAKVQADNTATAQELTTAKENLAKAENAKAIAEKALATANSEKQAVEKALNSAKTELSQAQTDLNTASSNLKTAQTELAKLQVDNTATAQELATAKENLIKAEQVKQQAEMALENKTGVITEIMRKAAAATQALGNEYSWIDYRDLILPQGLSKHPYISISGESLDGIFVGNHYIYLTPDVMLVARDSTAHWDSEVAKQDYFRVQGAYGGQTVELPKAGVANYVGHGFNADNVGTLSYQVDFANKIGSGSVYNFNNANIPTIQLAEGKILSGQIKADAIAGSATGKYELGFYGQDAQSIAGEVYISKQFEGGIATNGRTRNKYNDTQRGTHFGIVGEKQ